VFASRWRYKSGPLNVIGQFSYDGTGCKTRVMFVISHWSVSIRLLLVKLVCSRSVYIVSRVGLLEIRLSMSFRYQLSRVVSVLQVLVKMLLSCIDQ